MMKRSRPYTPLLTPYLLFTAVSLSNTCLPASRATHNPTLPAAPARSLVSYGTYRVNSSDVYADRALHVVNPAASLSAPLSESHL